MRDASRILVCFAVIAPFLMFCLPASQTLSPAIASSETVQPLLKQTTEIPDTVEDIGQLDLTPSPRTFSGTVNGTAPEVYYSFTLQAPSTVELKLSNLRAGANLFLGDAEANLIAKSNQPGTRNETITADLEPGLYYVLVRLVGNQRTSYNLSLQAQFITNELAISSEETDLTDPEFSTLSSQVTWQDKQGQLWVAPIAADGNFFLDQAEIITTGLAPIPAPNGTGNGPEWVYTSQGAEILYTRLQGGQFFLGRARSLNGNWVTETLPNSRFGHSPFGTLNPGDTDPLVTFWVGTPEKRRQAIAWGDLETPDSGEIVPYTQDSEGNVEGIRWVEGERALVYTLPIDDIKQVVRYDVDTQTLTQITFTQTQKGSAFMFYAPEYDELLVMTREVNANGSGKERIGIYRNFSGTWARIKTIDSPSTLTSIRSPEPFTYNGRSYVTFLTENKVGDPSEVWIAGIDPEVDFYRQVSDPNQELVRNDPEAFATDNGLFVYYAIRGRGVIIRADSGLGSINTTE